MIKPIPGREIMAILLDLIYAVAFVLYLPALALKGKLHGGYWMRLGRFPSEVAKSLQEYPNIWVHAVSVGEVLAVADLINKLTERFPQRRIVCSVVTATGYTIATEKLPKEVLVIYAPLDFSFIVRKFIRLIQPVVYIFAETEIWPNLFAQLHADGVPMIQVNGRISDQSFGGYQRLRSVTRRVLSKVDRFCMQSQLDADRILELGASPDAVKIIGNLKFDSLPEAVDLDPQTLGFRPEDQLLIAGSTHPGEEELIVGVYGRLKAKHPAVRLVLCPRHVQRCDDIMTMLKERGINAVRLSQAARSGGTSVEVFVVDTMGQLRNLYSLATVVIIGKTFTVGGGQNMIEPGYFAKPIIVGPMTQNFKDIVDIFLEEKALVKVRDAEELQEELLDLWGNRVRRESLGMAAKRVVEKFQGATEKTLREIEILGSGRQDAAIH